MKISRISRRITVTLCVVTLASIVNLVPAQAALRNGKATVKQLKGAAHYSVAKGVWVPLKLNATLKPGTLIKTAPESTVTLFFNENGSTLTANQNTVLRLTKLSSGQTGLESVSEADVDLIQGSVAGSHKKMSALSSLKINGVAVPSGNSYEIDSTGTAQVTKTESPIQFSSPQASESVILAQADRPEEKPSSPSGNNGVGNGEDPAPPGNPKPNDGPGTGPGNPGNGRPNRP